MDKYSDLNPEFLEEMKQEIILLKQEIKEMVSRNKN